MAIRCLEAAYGQRSAAMLYLRVEPTWDSLRDEPRFQDLLRRMRLD